MPIMNTIATLAAVGIAVCTWYIPGKSTCAQIHNGSTFWFIGIYLVLKVATCLLICLGMFERFFYSWSLIVVDHNQWFFLQHPIVWRFPIARHQEPFRHLWRVQPCPISWLAYRESCRAPFFFASGIGFLWVRQTADWFVQMLDGISPLWRTPFDGVVVSMPSAYYAILYCFSYTPEMIIPQKQAPVVASQYEWNDQADDSLSPVSLPKL